MSSEDIERKRKNHDGQPQWMDGMTDTPNPIEPTTLFKMRL